MKEEVLKQLLEIQTAIEESDPLLKKQPYPDTQPPLRTKYDNPHRHHRLHGKDLSVYFSALHHFFISLLLDILY